MTVIFLNNPEMLDLDYLELVVPSVPLSQINMVNS